MKMIFLWLLLGLLLGAALIGIARRRGLAGEKALLGTALVVAALLYVGFALVKADGAWILIESAGVVVFTVMVWLARRYAYIYLAIGWAIHPLWDSLLHGVGPGGHIAPDWYVYACLSFDLLVAVYIVQQNRRWRVSTGAP